jgi:GTP cyclohydrolase I|tara:strand:- start:2037 stop:2879 length:843 start_codon:yes stop_codon:yes gene_type:complete
MINLTWNDVYDRVAKLQFSKGDKVWGIPRGGSIVAGIAHLQLGVPIADSPESATIAIDDIIDSGVTSVALRGRYGLETVALVDKDREGLSGWIHFPWEEKPEQDIKESVRRIIQYIGDDSSRDGIIDTPDRVVKSWSTLFGGYEQDASSLLTWFEDDADEMVISKNIQFYSTCEHHMLPFFGTAVVGYIPDGKVLGISKLSRVVRSYARKLQIQERLTRQIGELIEPHVEGVGVHVEAQHLCMMARGVEQQDSTMVTNYLTGSFKDSPETRAEFLGVVNG